MMGQWYLFLLKWKWRMPTLTKSVACHVTTLLVRKLGARNAYLSEVTGMVFIKHDPVMMLTTSVTAASWMLSVLPNTTMARADMTPLLAVLLQP
jgi:hypothetical protein